MRRRLDRQLFSGIVQDAFSMGDGGIVLALTEIEGVPAAGAVLMIAGQRCRILDVARNSTDGQAVSTRACLTGQVVAAYGSVLIEWIEGAVATPDLHKMQVTEERANV